MNSRAVYVMGLALLLAGCAERNFTPGSPLAALAGHTRTYEEIAADDCVKAGHVRDGEPLWQCVSQLSRSRRQQDEAQRQRVGAAFTAAGAALLAHQPPPPPQPAPPNNHVCIAPNNTVYRC